MVDHARNALGFRRVGAVVISAAILLGSGVLSGFPVAEAASQSAARAKLEDGLAQPYDAPEFTGLKGWINAKPLRLSDLKGKVVLVDFWTYSCINCIRTLPYITAWDAKYRKDGLVIIGIHSPEFAFEQKAANVQNAVKKQGIQYPVALDNDLKTWQAFNNQYWPAHYLIDKSGKVVYTHFGEGNYDRTERNIQALLNVRGPQARVRPDVGPGFSLGQTPETYLGAMRTQSFASPGGLQRNQTARYDYPERLAVNDWALKGRWQVGPEFIQAKAPNASLRLHFNAKEVYLVLGVPKGQAIPVRLTLDGKPYGKPLSISEHRLYTLVRLDHPRQGLLELSSGNSGLEAYAFTFGG